MLSFKERLANNMKIGFVCGAFDLLHPGHLHLLKTCKENCDRLIVGLHTNPNTDRETKNVPIQSVFERWFQLKSTPWVDEIIPYDTEADLINLLATIEIDVRFLGSEYQKLPITGDEVCGSRGIYYHFINRLHTWSSSELRERFNK
jgi:glycerol-3-phosphate cytidylyltransferase